MNDYPIAANAETIRLITFSACNPGFEAGAPHCRPSSPIQSCVRLVGACAGDGAGGCVRASTG